MPVKSHQMPSAGQAIIAGTACALSEQQMAKLEELMGACFVDGLPYLAGSYGMLRSTLKGGSSPDWSNTRKEILASLKHVATVASKDDRGKLDAAIAGAVGVVRGYYLPWHVSRLIGGPGLRGFDPQLVGQATPQEIEEAARAAMKDERLAPALGGGRQKDVAGRRLIHTVIQAYEMHTGRPAKADGRGSIFLDALCLVAAYVGWITSEHTLRERAYEILHEVKPGSAQVDGPLMWIAKVQAQKI